MKISIGEMMAALERDGKKAYEKLSELRSCIKQIQEEWTDKNYVEVRIVNRDGDIVSILKRAFPELENIWWEGDPGYCGENVVLVPADMWNEVLEHKLGEFDSFIGHHQETRRDWKLRDDAELPWDLKNEIDRIKLELEKNGKSTDSIVIPGYERRSRPWCQCTDHEWNGCFVEVQTVIREWDVKLAVNDRREWAKYDEALKAKTIEI